MNQVAISSKKLIIKFSSEDTVNAEAHKHVINTIYDDYDKGIKDFIFDFSEVTTISSKDIAFFIGIAKRFIDKGVSVTMTEFNETIEDVFKASNLIESLRRQGLNIVLKGE